jgi:hypothetical protein
MAFIEHANALEREYDRGTRNGCTQGACLAR